MREVKEVGGNEIDDSNHVSCLNWWVRISIVGMLPWQDSVDESERVRHWQLMEVIGWFFFDLLMLGYVEDSDTGQSFRIPGGRSWAIYVEVGIYECVTLSS